MRWKGEKCGFVVQEVNPVVKGLSLGLLVGDEAYGQVLTIAFGSEYVSQGFLHGDALATEFLALLQEVLVHLLVVQGVVDLCPVPRFAEPQGEGGHPFPVSIVPQVGKTELFAFAQQGFLHLIDTHKLYTSFHFVCRHGLEFQRLYNVVAEEVIEAAFYQMSFLIALLRETAG